MGTMNKMRENTGVVLWILVFAFGVIWVLQDSGALDSVGSATTRDILIVNGEAVPYEEFAQAVDAQVQQYQQRTGETMPPQLVDQTREQVYNAYVEDLLRGQEMDRLGVEVSDAELIAMVQGDNPHPLIKLYFGDGQGGVDRALLQNFIDNPEAAQQWVQIESTLRSARRREKMEALLNAAARVSEQDIEDEHRKANLKADAQWVGLRYAEVPDDQVEVTDRDLRTFYNDNKEDFARKKTFLIDYVTRSKQPSAEDSTRVMESLERMKPRLAAAEDDSLFLVRNASERPYTSAWFTAGDLDAPIANALFANGTPAVGTVVGPVFAGDEAHVLKVTGVQPAAEPAVRARHILFRGTTDEVRTQAQQIKERIQQGAAFAEMAAQYGTDGTRTQGGDLGWFSKGAMVAEFEDAVFGARIGEVVGPVQTQFGYHLIEVTARAEQEVQLADYAERVRTDVATLNRMQERLEDLRYYTEESGNFEQEAERLGLAVQQVQFEDGQTVIPGLGNSRGILNFLRTAERGELSEVIELDNEFVVVHLRETTDAGYRSFDEVKAELEPRVKKQKKAAIQRQKLEAALDEHGFDGLAAALGVPQRVATQVNFNSPIVANLGREPKFTGTALGLQEGEVSRVIEGENTVYVLKTVTRYEPAALTDAQRQQIRQRLLSQRRSQLKSQWIAQLRDEADIEDNRYRFQQ